MECNLATSSPHLAQKNMPQNMLLQSHMTRRDASRRVATPRQGSVADVASFAGWSFCPQAWPYETWYRVAEQTCWNRFWFLFGQKRKIVNLNLIDSKPSLAQDSTSTRFRWRDRSLFWHYFLPFLVLLEQRIAAIVFCNFVRLQTIEKR